VGYRWHEHDERFDARAHPNEPNRFGWVVEIDPMDPSSTPVKRTALGRAAHEGAWVAVTKDGRAVVYSWARTRASNTSTSSSAATASAPAVRPGQPELLDHGTLYVARFDADGRGRWLPLVHGQGPLTAANGFADQGEVLIKAARPATCWAPPRWTAPSGWPSTRAAAGSTAR
jgi:secreted PhoX family phosphatase